MGVRRKVGGFVLRVNPILCDGFGHCHELAPELVKVDEWGYPIIQSTPTPLADLGARMEEVAAVVRAGSEVVTD